MSYAAVLIVILRVKLSLLFEHVGHRVNTVQNLEWVLLTAMTNQRNKKNLNKYKLHSHVINYIC